MKMTGMSLPRGVTVLTQQRRSSSIKISITVAATGMSLAGLNYGLQSIYVSSNVVGIGLMGSVVCWFRCDSDA